MPSLELGYTGDWQTWRVPAKLEWVEVVVDGAGSDRTRGGRVSGRINVKGKNNLRVLVGGRGTLSGAATVGGGGAAGHGRGYPDGWSGGGASIIRVDSTTGTLMAVGGGAGGQSGDTGLGGVGGADVGEAGRPGNLATGTTGNATGGTQIQGGNGGNSSAGATLAGIGAADTPLSPGGAGGQSALPLTVGGGGGGGGYRGGGGGQAGLFGETPGGGGGGGSSYIGGLTGYTNTQAGGAEGNGHVTLTWVTPAPANQPPTPPTEVKIGGVDYTDELATLSVGTVTIAAKVNDPNRANDVRLVVQYAPDNTFAQFRTLSSKLVNRGKVASVTLTGLSQNTLWHARLFSQDKAGLLSTNYTSLKFWTNRGPNPPELLSPGDNSTIEDIDSILFTWNHTDPDHPETPHQKAFNLQWRRAGTPLTRAGQWEEVTYESADETYVGEPEVFKANTTYEWRVRTQDEQGMWGLFSLIRSFYVAGSSAPPWPTYPISNEAVELGDGLTFTWLFRDPASGALQTTADLRFRAVGSNDWQTMFGSATLPGALSSWFVRPEVLQPGNYEWQVRTVSNNVGSPGDWSDPETFWLVRTPGTSVEPVVAPHAQTIEARLGCGNNEVHVYRRGGLHYCGQIKPLTTLTWSRRRDDIANILLDTNGTGSDCGALLRDIHTWTHELVIFRDGERVAEGPITRLTDTPTGFHIEAKDVMAYPYRRIMRQGYNDAYRILNNTQVGQYTVVRRARQILLNALAPDDPNVLPYLTTFDFPDDARQSRSVPDFSKMAWEEVDSLAATGGLDYTTVGRRIILNDTHRPIGRLPELRTQHFNDPPVVSEYGMQLATDFGVTNNNGVYGLVSRRTEGELGPYGLVEQLASAYGETEGTGPVETMTSEAQGDLELVLTAQAERNIASRWPAPQIVRVPDNSMLMPDTPVHINDLVPGVWIPLRAEGTIRSIAQWQKLDQVTVTQDANGEKITVTMSPAPNRGQDPDAEGETEEA